MFIFLYQSKMSFHTKVSVPVYLSQSVMGNHIEIVDEDTGKTRSQREGIYNIMEVYKLQIKYDKANENFVVIGSDSTNVDNAAKVLRKVGSKKKEEYEDYIERKKKRQQYEQHQHFKKKEKEIKNKVEKAQQGTKNINKTENACHSNLMKSNRFYGLFVHDNDDETDEDDAKTEHQKEKQRRTLLRRINYMKKHDRHEELAKYEQELRVLDNNYSPEDDQTDNQTENQTENESQLELHDELESYDEIQLETHDGNQLETLDEIKLETQPINNNEDTGASVQDQLNNFIEKNEPGVPRNRGYYQQKHYPRRGNQRQEGNEFKNNNNEWKPVGGAGFYKPRNNRNNRPKNQNNRYVDQSTTDDMDFNTPKLPHDHIKDKLDELIGTDYNCDFPPLLSNSD
jgi:hypothetical protein